MLSLRNSVPYVHAARSRIGALFFIVGFGLGAIVMATACSGGMDPGDLVDGAPLDDDGLPIHNGDCEQGGQSSSNSYLPFEVGNRWRYRVDDLSGAPPTLKSQELAEVVMMDDDGEPIIKQVTIKASGRTENWLQRQGDALVRLRQQDFDTDEALERTTHYLQRRLRLDESPEHVIEGANWQDNFIRLIEDPFGVETKRELVSDQWAVLGVDVPCTTPWGELKCLHVRRVRLEGGESQKEYYFARGYGKVLEIGNLIEELVGCELR